MDLHSQKEANMKRCRESIAIYYTEGKGPEFPHSLLKEAVLLTP